MKKFICLMLCLICALAFVSCQKKSTEGITEKETSAVSTSDVSEASQKKSDKQKESTAASAGESANNKKKTTTSASSTTTATPMPSTEANEAIPISVEEALEMLSNFYGRAYTVEKKGKKGDIQFFEVYDKHKNLYAKLEVNLKNSNVIETIEHSGEVNMFNLLV